MYNQCSHELRVKLKVTSGYSSSKCDNNVIALLMMIKGYCCQFNALNDEYVTIVGAIKNLLYFSQKPSQSIADYHKDFLTLVEVIKEYRGAGSLTYFLNMMKKELTAVKAPDSNSGKAMPEKGKEARKI